MKKLALAISAPVSCVLLLTYCNSVLDTKPLGSLTSASFYQTEKDFASAVLGTYVNLQDLVYDQFGRGLWNGWLLPDDDADYRDPNNANDAFNWTANNPDFAWVWQNAYTAIMRANLVIQQLPEATGFTNPAHKDLYDGQAKFMRAYWYFLLARSFGDVPILTTVSSSVDETRVGNSQPGEVWDLIESDLKDAVKELPNDWGAEKGRATNGAAQALLGKVQLYRAQWFNQPAKYQEAAANLQAVVNSGRYQLMDDFYANQDETQENNAESLFEFQASVGDNIDAWDPSDNPGGFGSQGQAWTIYVSPSCFYGTNGGCAPKSWGEGYGQVSVSKSLQSEFEPGDPRKYFTMYSTDEDYGGVPYQRNGGKFELWSSTGSTPSKMDRPFDPNRFPNNRSVNNIRLLMYDDVLLMLAEAKLLGSNDIAGAAQLVNQVRARARGSYRFAYGAESPDAELYKSMGMDTPPANLLPDVSASLSPAAMLRAIMHERRVEFALDPASHRYDDLVRWHRAGLIDLNGWDWGAQVPAGSWKERNLLRPIPQGELDLNPNLKQNPGY